MSIHNRAINYEGIDSSCSIFFIEILIPEGLGEGPYPLLMDLVTRLYKNNERTILRDVEDIPYGAPRAIVAAIPDRGVWPLLGVEGGEGVRVVQIWPPTDGEGEKGKEGKQVNERKEGKESRESE